MIKFRINEMDWKSGHTGHLELKEAFDTEIAPAMAENGLRLTVVSDTDTPLKDEQLISMAATLMKSYRHLNFLTGSRRYEASVGSPWKTYQSTANMERVATTLPPWVKINLEDRTLTVTLWEPCTKEKAVVLATVRRMINLLEWAWRVELRLTSSKCFKWSTFNRLSVNQIYQKPTP